MRALHGSGVTGSPRLHPGELRNLIRDYDRGERNSVQHEASVSKVSEDMIFYMQQRGLTEGQAMSLAVNGFINDLARQFPMEYSVELKRLIDLEMEGSVG
jgi:Fe-S cluster assembly protein SufB